MVLLLCGLAGFFFAQLAKQLFPIQRYSLLKMVLAAVGSTAVAVVELKTIQSVVVYGAAGTGLAMLVHRFSRVLSVIGDWHIVQIMKSGRR